jgi:GT2 family glycosyltransferase
VARSLDIVIVSFNGRDDLAACLRSLHDAPPSIPHAIVVVDNASSDGSAEMVRARFPSVAIVENDSNQGFARANNRGIREGRGELVLLLNSDTVVPAGALDGLIAALEACPEAAAAGPRLVDGGGVAELSFGPMITPWNELRQKVTWALHLGNVGPVRRRVERAAKTRQFPDWVTGACLLVWRADAEAVGLLDERYFMYTEDVDFCAALRARGRRVLFAPEVEVTHLRGRSRTSAPHAVGDAYRRSQLAFYGKHHPRWLPWLRIYLRLKGALPRGSETRVLS